MKHKRILKFLFVLIFLVGLSGLPGVPGFTAANSESQVSMKESVILHVSAGSIIFVHADDGAGDLTPRDATPEDERLGSNQDWLYAGYTVAIIILGIIIDVIVKKREKKKLKTDLK